MLCPSVPKDCVAVLRPDVGTVCVLGPFVYQYDGARLFKNGKEISALRRLAGPVGVLP